MVLSPCFTPAHQPYTFVPEKSLYIFVTATQGALPDSLASRAYGCSPTELYIFICY